MVIEVENEVIGGASDAIMKRRMDLQIWCLYNLLFYSVALVHMSSSIETATFESRNAPRVLQIYIQFLIIRTCIEW